MPSPTEVLLRVQASPVPTQMVLGALGSMAMAPIDCTSCLSKTGLKVVPPFEDFQTPPLADPTYTVRRPSSFTAAIAETRPLMAAEPMLRAPRPEIVSESNLISCADEPGEKQSKPKTRATSNIVRRNELLILANPSCSNFLRRSRNN